MVVNDIAKSCRRRRTIKVVGQNFHKDEGYLGCFYNDNVVQTSKTNIKTASLVACISSEYNITQFFCVCVYI